jgi:hypothetical protein
MADLDEGPGPGADTEPPGEARDWGRALDIAGIVAGVFLIVIIADIATDGKLISRHLIRKPKGDEPVEPE